MSDPYAESHAQAFAELLEVLDLRCLGNARISVEGAPGDDETDMGHFSTVVFVGRSQKRPRGRVFGGQVLAQAIVAAGRTLPENGQQRLIHSLHAYFVRPGDDSHDIRFITETLMDGRSFSTRRVHAIQYGKTLLSMIASFQVPAGGMDHQREMPAAPEPEWLPTIAQAVGDDQHPAARFVAQNRPVDLRHVEGGIYLSPGKQHSAHQNVWMKAVGQLPDDPLVHAAVLAYASDYTLLEPVLRRHGIAWADPRLRAASLDHAMWFHRPVRADEWVLYTHDSPSAGGGRGLAIGNMFASDGRLVVTVAQEGMLRLKDG